MEPARIARRAIPFALAVLGVAAAAPPARADGCDGLTVRLVRATGATFTGRAGPVVVFRAADADRMSLDCRHPRTVLLRSDARTPNRAYFVLVGLAAQGLAGARTEAVEVLALRLHQETLLTGLPQTGRAGPVALRCEPGDRLDGLTDGTLCRLTPAGREGLRRKAGLSASAIPG